MWYIGPLQLTFSHTKESYHHRTGAKVPWFFLGGEHILMCHHGKLRDKAYKADSSLKANGIGDGHEADSAVFGGGATVRGQGEAHL